jgi:hypothetical protein
MILLLTFAVIVLVGQAANIGVSLAVEQFSETASLPVFLALFALVFVGGWLLAVRLNERLFGAAQRDRSA